MKTGLKVFLYSLIVSFCFLSFDLYRSQEAQGASQTLSTSYFKKVITAAGAGANHTTTDNTDTAVLGKAIDYGLARSASFQINWTSLTGTVNATLAVYSSVDCTNYVAKSDASGSPVSITLSGASGSNIISMTDIVTEPCYQLRYTAGTVTGGTINAYAYGKR